MWVNGGNSSEMILPSRKIITIFLSEENIYIIESKSDT